MRGDRNKRRTPYRSREHAGVGSEVLTGRRPWGPAAPKRPTARGFREPEPQPAPQPEPQPEPLPMSPAPVGLPSEVQWVCQTDNGEVAYPPEINSRLELSFNESLESPVEFNGSEFGGQKYMYTVDTLRMVQTNRKTNVERQVVRYVNGQASSWTARRDGVSGRTYFYDNTNPSPTWVVILVNPLCPSTPFYGVEDGSWS